MNHSQYSSSAFLSFLLLFFQLSVGAAADQTVPIPDDLKQPLSGITIAGEVFPGQNQYFKYLTWETDSKGNIKKETASEWVMVPLNQEVTLAPGVYTVNYAGIPNLVKLAVGEHKVIQLGKVTVPKVDGTYQIQVLQDTTKKEEQEKLATLFWGMKQGNSATNFYSFCRRHHCNSSSYESWITQDELCKSKSKRRMGTDLCNAFNSGNYARLVGPAIRFDKDGVLSAALINWEDQSGTIVEGANSRFEVQERFVSGRGTDGDSFALLPGTYTIKMTNFAGKTVTKTGIAVKIGDGL